MKLETAHGLPNEYMPDDVIQALIEEGLMQEVENEDETNIDNRSYDYN